MFNRFVHWLRSFFPHEEEFDFDREIVAMLERLHARPGPPSAPRSHETGKPLKVEFQWKPVTRKKPKPRVKAVAATGRNKRKTKSLARHRG